MNALDPTLVMGLGIFGIIVIVAVFLVCRIVACWYFRINEIVKVLTEIRDRLPSRESAESESKEANSSTGV